MKRIAWGITGAGHFLTECVDLLIGTPNLDIYLSQAAGEVMQMYGLVEKILNSGAEVNGPRHSIQALPMLSRISQGKYRVLLVAPTTGNTMAKFVYGIADTLVTNLFAQAGKSRVPTIVLPVDVADEIDSPDPKGKLVKVYPRQVDLENVARLREFPYVTVVTSPEELKASLNQYL
jgi:dihydromethanopterin reductase (acceptor)